jgi:hypothetical protein
MMNRTRKSVGNNAARKPRADFSDPAGCRGFQRPSKAAESKRLALRRLIFETAKATKGVGALQETLKWGQPNYDLYESIPNRAGLHNECANFHIRARNLVND